MNTVETRDANLDDAEVLLTIYTPFVLHTATSFEITPPTIEDFRVRIADALDRFSWQVATVDRRPVGYIYATSHRSRPAYQWSVESSIYLDHEHRGRGVGTLLYRSLLRKLRSLGYCNVYAGITLPNDASIALHQKLGFSRIGIFPRVGFKFNAWQDLSWWHLPIQDAPATKPAAPNRQR